MSYAVNAMTVPSRAIVRNTADNHSQAPPRQSFFVRRSGVPHWIVAFTVAGQHDIVNVVTYARDERGAVNAAKRALTGMRYTFLWAFETLDREKVQELLSAAILRERNAARGRDAADEARARVDVVRFQRELAVLEQSRVV